MTDERTIEEAWEGKGFVPGARPAAGASGTRYGGGNRSGRDRLASILPAIQKGDEFRARIASSEGDPVRLADLMAEAIRMDRDAREVESVSRAGKVTFSMERLQAAFCMDEAAAAYLKARGSNRG